MRRVVSLLLGVLGLWFAVAGVWSVAASPPDVPVPAPTTGLLLGLALLTAAVLLWPRARRRPGTGGGPAESAG